MKHHFMQLLYKPLVVLDGQYLENVLCNAHNNMGYPEFFEILGLLLAENLGTKSCMATVCSYLCQITKFDLIFLKSDNFMPHL